MWPLGDGEGVRVGEVLLEVAEVPEGGRLLGSGFCTGYKTRIEAISRWSEGMRMGAVSWDMAVSSQQLI